MYVGSFPIASQKHGECGSLSSLVTVWSAVILSGPPFLTRAGSINYRLTGSNWAALVLSALLLSSKVWDDESFEILDVSELLHDIKQTNQNQWKLQVPNAVKADTPSAQTPAPSHTRKLLAEMERAFVHMISFDVLVSFGEWERKAKELLRGIHDKLDCDRL